MRIFDASVEKFLGIMESKGAIITKADDAMRREWVMGMDNVAKDWAAKLDSAGQPGSKILKIYMDAMWASGAVPLRNWDKE